MRSSRVIPAAVVFLAAGIAAGCSASGGPAAAPAAEKPDLTVAAVPVADDAGLYIAADQGLFKAAGLNVKIVSVAGGADALQGQKDGKYDITAGNAVSYIQAAAAGQPDLEIIAEGSVMQPNDQALYTLPGSPVASIASLKGHRIGVNTLNNIGTLMISSVLEEHGVSPRSVRFVPVGFPLMAQALRRHTIDAAWLPEPFGSQDSAGFGFTELADLDQGAASGFPIGWYVATRAWATKHPGTLAAFLGALRQGQQIADTSRTAIEHAMEKLPAPYAVSPMIAALMSVPAYPLSVAPGIDQAHVQRVADAMYRYRLLARPFNASTLLR
jgi:NitT/TauT family transport system substrate-binding protein